MNKDTTWKDNNFFLITSENVDHVARSYLYGYCITEHNVYRNQPIIARGVNAIDAVGAWIFIEKEEDQIVITQDLNGCYLIYYFVNDDYWAVSNDFWLICEDVSKKYPLTLNEQFAMHYMNTPMSAVTTVHTLLNEIRIMPLFTKILIKDGQMKLQEDASVMRLGTVSLDSEAGMEIIDQWIEKWSGMIKGAYQAGIPIQFDLSGGFDSRISFAIGLDAGIDFCRDQVMVKSYIAQNAGAAFHYSDDYTIAQKIADKIGFELNRELKGRDAVRLSAQDSYDIYDHAFSGVHPEPYFHPSRNRNTKFIVKGLFGETVRMHLRSLNDNSKSVRKNKKFDSLTFLELIESYESACDGLCKEDKNYKYKTMQKYKMQTQGRTHEGLVSVENALVNEYTLDPLSDLNLLKVNPVIENCNVGTNIIFAVILYRCCPELVEIPFTHGEKFSKETLKKAKMLHISYPRKRKTAMPYLNLDYTVLQSAGLFEEVKAGEDTNAKKVLLQHFYNQEYQELFEKKYGKYGNFLRGEAEKAYMENKKYMPLKDIVRIVSVSKALYYEHISSPYNNDLAAYHLEIKRMKKIVMKYPDIDIYEKYLNELKEIRDLEYKKNIRKDKNNV